MYNSHISLREQTAVKLVYLINFSFQTCLCLPSSSLLFFFFFLFYSHLPPASPPRDGDTVISAIIYLLMQTRPCPRYAAGQNIHVAVTVRPIKDEIGGT